MKDNKYEVHEQYWVVSEVKASLVEVYNNYLKAQENYVRALKGILDPNQTKAEYVSALYGFYTLLLNGFPTYLEKLEKPTFTEDDYIKLAISTDHEDEKLIKMGYVLQKWASTQGPFRITHQDKVYNDPVDMLEDENQTS